MLVIVVLVILGVGCDETRTKYVTVQTNSPEPNAPKEAQSVPALVNGKTVSVWVTDLNSDRILISDSIQSRVMKFAVRANTDDVIIQNPMLQVLNAGGSLKNFAIYRGYIPWAVQDTVYGNLVRFKSAPTFLSRGDVMYFTVQADVVGPTQIKSGARINIRFHNIEANLVTGEPLTVDANTPFVKGDHSPHFRRGDMAYVNGQFYMYVDHLGTVIGEGSQPTKLAIADGNVVKKLCGVPYQVSYIGNQWSAYEAQPMFGYFPGRPQYNGFVVPVSKVQKNDFVPGATIRFSKKGKTVDITLEEGDLILNLPDWGYVPYENFDPAIGLSTTISAGWIVWLYKSDDPSKSGLRIVDRWVAPGSPVDKADSVFEGITLVKGDRIMALPSSSIWRISDPAKAQAWTEFPMGTIAIRKSLNAPGESTISAKSVIYQDDLTGVFSGVSLQKGDTISILQLPRSMSVTQMLQEGQPYLWQPAGAPVGLAAPGSQTRVARIVVNSASLECRIKSFRISANVSNQTYQLFSQSPRAIVIRDENSVTVGSGYLTYAFGVVEVSAPLYSYKTLDIYLDTTGIGVDEELSLSIAINEWYYDSISLNADADAPTLANPVKIHSWGYLATNKLKF